MGTKLADAAAATDMTADGIAVITGQALASVEQWFAIGIVPSEHRETVAQAVGLSSSDLDGSEELPSPSEPDSESASNGSGRARPAKRATGRRKARSSERNVAAETTNAVRLCAAIAHMDAGRRAQLEQIGQIDSESHDPVEQLQATTLRLLSLPKATTDAFRAISDLANHTNPIMMGAELGNRNRKELTEIYRLCCILNRASQDDLPSGTDSLVVVADAIGRLDDAAKQTLDEVSKLS